MKTWSYIVQNKIAVSIIALILLILVIWALFRFRKAKGGKGDPAVTNITTSDTRLIAGSPNYDPAAVEEMYTTARNLAARLYNEMSGWNVWSRDYTPYQELLAVDDAVFQQTYNEFNVRYGEGETLRQWLMDEYAVGVPGFAALRTAIFDKMDKYGLQ